MSNVQSPSVTATRAGKRATTTAPSFVPSLQRTTAVRVVDRAPAGKAALGVAVRASGPVPAELAVDRNALLAAGFEGKPGQTLVLPRPGAPIVAVGVGDARQVGLAEVRNAAAAFSRASARQAAVALTVPQIDGMGAEAVAQALVEGAVLARYSYDPLRRDPSCVPIMEVILVADPGDSEAVERGATRGLAFARAGHLSRDLANAPPAHLTAHRMAEVAEHIAATSGLDIEVTDRDGLMKLGCGGLLGVNRGSVDPPYMIKLTYRPKGMSRGHLSLVGKGIMYDSGGISLKPGDAVHATMKNDMSGAGAILSAMSVLSELGCESTVTGYLMCTDNMPSGSALKLGDVITIHGGTTVEILSTDAEGRLVMADALVLASEEKPDAIVDIATLTGACLRALGTRIAGVMGNDQEVVDQVIAAGTATDEPAWQFPLERSYRKELDSDVADIKNLGGQNAGQITAALFLEEFVDGHPWAHIDIAGTSQLDAPDARRNKGATGFGARLLIELATNFAPPGSRPAAVGRQRERARAR